MITALAAGTTVRAKTIMTATKDAQQRIGNIKGIVKGIWNEKQVQRQKKGLSRLETARDVTKTQKQARVGVYPRGEWTPQEEKAGGGRGRGGGVRIKGSVDNKESWRYRVTQRQTYAHFVGYYRKPSGCSNYICHVRSISLTMVMTLIALIIKTNK